jgi:hypothetical protein
MILLSTTLFSHWSIPLSKKNDNHLCEDFSPLLQSKEAGFPFTVEGGPINRCYNVFFHYFFYFFPSVAIGLLQGAPKKRTFNLKVVFVLYKFFAGSSKKLIDHKVHIYLEYHSVCPLVRIGTPPLPLPRASVSTPGTKGGRHTRLWVRVGGGPKSDVWRKNLVLCSVL